MDRHTLPWCWCCSPTQCLCGGCLAYNTASPLPVRTVACCAGMLYWWAGMYVDPSGKPVRLRRDRFPEQLAKTGTFNGVRSSDHVAPSTKQPGLEIPCRVYEPVVVVAGGDVAVAAASGLPVMMYFHGGGFCIMDARSGDMDRLCQKLCRENSAVVVSVSYRLAPEHAFPCAVHDCMDALKWVADSNNNTVLTKNIDLGKGVVLAGDSAGGNLACVLASLCRDGLDSDLTPMRLDVSISAQLLLYPVLFNSVDADTLAKAPREFLPDPFVRWFTRSYFGVDSAAAAADRTQDRRVNPYVAGYAGMPKTVVVTCGRDLLQYDGKIAVQQMRDAGVQVVHLHYDNMAHSFATMHFLKESSQVVTAASQAIKAAAAVDPIVLA